MISNFSHISKENFNIKVLLSFIFFFPAILLLGSAIINLSILIMNIFFLFYVFNKKKYQIFKNDIFYFLLSFWFLLIFNTLLNDDFNQNYSRAFFFLRFILLIFLFSYFISYKDSKYRDLIFNIWTIIFIIVSLDLVFEFFFGFNILGFKSNYSGRLAGFLGDELKIGHWYFCFSLILLGHNSNNLKYFYFLLFFSLIISFFIGERANFIRLFLAISFFLVFTKNLSFKILGSLLIATVLIFIIGNSADKIIKKRFIGDFVSLIKNYESFKTFNEKNPYTPMYLNAYNIFKENKLLGVGVGSYLEKSHENFRISKPEGNTVNGYLILPNSHPHQHHFEILATMGLSGYLFLLIFFLYFFFKAFKFYLIQKDNINLSSFLMVFFMCLPLLPTGSFFTTYGASMFWLNFALMNLGNFKNIN